MIHFKNVSKKFNSNAPVLNEIDFHIEKGSFILLIGPSGSGKTTIFRLIIRDVLPSGGEIIVNDWNLNKLPKDKVPSLRRRVGVVFQDLKLLFDRTVVENVMLPLELANFSEKDARRKAEEALIEVGLETMLDKFPLQLSGGERQRVAIARALVFNPDIILADEPTGNLDLNTSLQIINLLRSINKKGTTVFMATHNDKIINESTERVVLLTQGKIIEYQKKEEISKK